MGLREGRDGWVTDLISFVVVLGIVLEHLGLLGVLEVSYEVICAELFPPFLIVDEPVSVSRSVSP